MCQVRCKLHWYTAQLSPNSSRLVIAAVSMVIHVLTQHKTCTAYLHLACFMRSSLVHYNFYVWTMNDPFTAQRHRCTFIAPFTFACSSHSPSLTPLCEHLSCHAVHPLHHTQYYTVPALLWCHIQVSGSATRVVFQHHHLSYTQPPSLYIIGGTPHTYRAGSYSVNHDLQGDTLY